MDWTIRNLTIILVISAVSILTIFYFTFWSFNYENQDKIVVQSTKTNLTMMIYPVNDSVISKNITVKLLNLPSQQYKDIKFRICYPDNLRCILPDLGFYFYKNTTYEFTFDTTSYYNDNYTLWIIWQEVEDTGKGLVTHILDTISTNVTIYNDRDSNNTIINHTIVLWPKG